MASTRVELVDLPTTYYSKSSWQYSLFAMLYIVNHPINVVMRPHRVFSIRRSFAKKNYYNEIDIDCNVRWSARPNMELNCSDNLPHSRAICF